VEQASRLLLILEFSLIMLRSGCVVSWDAIAFTATLCDFCMLEKGVSTDEDHVGGALCRMWWIYVIFHLCILWPEVGLPVFKIWIFSQFSQFTFITSYSPSETHPQKLC